MRWRDVKGVGGDWRGGRVGGRCSGVGLMVLVVLGWLLLLLLLMPLLLLMIMLLLLLLLLLLLNLQPLLPHCMRRIHRHVTNHSCSISGGLRTRSHFLRSHRSRVVRFGSVICNDVDNVNHVQHGSCFHRQPHHQSRASQVCSSVQRVAVEHPHGGVDRHVLYGCARSKRWGWQEGGGV